MILRDQIFWVFAVGCFSSLTVSASVPSLRANGFFEAEGRKRGIYVKEGTIHGGDRTVDNVIVLDVRRGENEQDERIVLDLEGTRNGETVSVDKPPYFNVAVSSATSRIIVTLWGKPQVAFDVKKVRRAFKGSHFVSDVKIFPPLEKDRWTFELTLKRDVPVEVIHLPDPVRVVIDLKKAVDN